MQFTPLSLFAVLGLVLSIPNNASAQGKLERVADLRIPVYDSEVLEITAARLDEVETLLKNAPDLVAQDKAISERSTASNKYHRCQQEFQASKRSDPAPQAQQNAPNPDEMKKRAAEIQERIKNAKTPEEKQKIAMEFALSQQSAQSAQQQAQQIEQATRQQEEYQRQLEAKCGPEPTAEAAPRVAENKPLTVKPGYSMLFERVAGYCGNKMQSVGPDGAVSALDTPFRWKGINRGFMMYNVWVYSPKEAAILEKRCPELQPLLISRKVNTAI